MMENTVGHTHALSAGFVVEKPPDRTQISISPFLTLPREIRDTIYSLCFLPGNYVFQELEHQFKIRLVRNHRNYRERFPCWMLASKQVLDEAMQQFYRDAVFTYVRGADKYAGCAGELLTLR